MYGSRLKFALFAFLAILALASTAGAQVTVSGNLKDLGLNNATSPTTFVRFTLQNYGSNTPRVLGSNTIVNPVRTFFPDAMGVIGGSIQGNDTISPTNTFYQACVFYQGTLSFPCQNYLITGGTFDLNTASPISSGATPPAPLAILAMNWRGAWSSGTPYSANMTVSYMGASYISLVNSNMGNTPDSSPSDWGVLAAQGTTGATGGTGPTGPAGPGIAAWSNVITYSTGAAVTYMTQLYVSIAGGNLNHLPTDTMHWSLQSGASPGGSSGDVQTNNGTGGFAGGTQLSLLGQKYPFGGPVQYVCPAAPFTPPGCSDSNDGLSPGTAVADLAWACEQLSGGSHSTKTCGQGTVKCIAFCQASYQGNDCGLQIQFDASFGGTTCWENQAGSAMAVICDGGGATQFNGSFNMCSIIGGSTSDEWHPGLWLSGVNHTITLQNLSFNAAVPAIISVCLDHTTLSCGSSGLSIVNSQFAITPASCGTAANYGPGMFFGDRNLFMTFTNINVTGNSSCAAGGPTADNAAAILFKSCGGGNGSGGMYFTNVEMQSGGFKLCLGNADMNININGMASDNDDFNNGTEAQLWVEVGDGGSFGGSIYGNGGSGAVDCNDFAHGGNSDCYTIRNDTPFTISTTGIRGQSVGCLNSLNVNGTISTVTPLTMACRYGQLGPSRYRAQTDSLSRNFPPVTVPGTSLLSTNLNSISVCGACTLHTGITDPSNGTQAIEVTDTDADPGDTITIAYSSDGGAVVGDSFIQQVWIKYPTAGACCGNNSGIGLFVLNGGSNNCLAPPDGFGSLTSGQVKLSPITSASVWELYPIICKIATGYSTNTPSFSFSVSSTQPLEMAFPNAVLLHGYSDSDVQERAISPASWNSSCAAGTTCDPLGEVPHITPGVGGALAMTATGFISLTDAATITWDMLSQPNPRATVTLGGNRTLNLVDIVEGGTGILTIVQDGMGSRSLTLGSCGSGSFLVSPGGSGAISLSTAASAVDILSWIVKDGNCYATLNPNYN